MVRHMKKVDSNKWEEVTQVKCENFTATKGNFEEVCLMFSDLLEQAVLMLKVYP